MQTQICVCSVPGNICTCWLCLLHASFQHVISWPQFEASLKRELAVADADMSGFVAEFSQKDFDDVRAPNVCA